MPKRNQWLLIGLAAVVVFFLLMAAYSSSRKNTQPGPNVQQGAPQGQVVPMLPNNITAPNEPSAQTQKAENLKKAEAVKSTLSKMKEVKEVNVYVDRNTCLVGYKPVKPSGDLNALTSTIKRNVTQTDSSLTNVMVTTVPDIKASIDKLSKDAADSKPMSDLSSRMNQIMQKIRTDMGTR